MSGWTAHTKLVWGGVIAAAMAALLWTTIFQPGAPPGTVQGWAGFVALTIATFLLALRPVELASDRKVTLASVPAVVLALVYEPLPSTLAAGAAAVAAQTFLRRPWYVATFNVAQRVLAVIATATAAEFARLVAGEIMGLDAVAGTLAYLLVNTSLVAAISAARRGAAHPVSWLTTWRQIAAHEGPVEAALVATGALCATLRTSASAALLLLIPPLWLGGRTLRDAHRIDQLNAQLTDAVARQRRFISDAAHELRTPVAALRAQAEALRRDLAGADGSLPPAGSWPVDATAQPTVRLPSPRDRASPPETVEQMVSDAARLSRLLADLLTLAQGDEGAPLEREPVDLEALLLDVYREALSLAGAVMLQVDLDGDEPPVVTGDRERLRQMLLNLVSNGIRHTSAGGRVTLRCRCADGAAEIAVADTGIGIPPQDLPHVFDRFYRADTARVREGLRPDGAGLGLAIARWVAEAHGGTIQVESTVGAGSVFTVRLPAAAPDR